jgi:hypothetical protein
LNAPVSKTGKGLSVLRGFESPPLRWLTLDLQAERHRRAQVPATWMTLAPYAGVKVIQVRRERLHEVADPEDAVTVRIAAPGCGVGTAPSWA